MGIFTVYCICCGGPPYDITEALENLETIQSKKDNTYTFNILEEEFSWLEYICCISEKEISEIGSYDMYGRFEIKEGDKTYCVAPINWSRDDQDYLNNIYSNINYEIPGLLIHEDCLNILKVVITDFETEKFWKIFSNLADLCGCSLNPSINYGPIEKTQGQTCEFDIKELHLFYDPTNYVPCSSVCTRIENKEIEILEITPPIEKKNYILPYEIFNYIMEFLDYKTLITLNLICRDFYFLSNDDRLWNNLVEYYFLVDLDIKLDKKLPIGFWKQYFVELMLDPNSINRKRIIENCLQIKDIYDKKSVGIPRKFFNYTQMILEKSKFKKK